MEKKIPFWPSIKEQHKYYSKLDTKRDLDYIAKVTTSTLRPFIMLEPPLYGNFVAKRFEFYSTDIIMFPDTKQDLFQRFQPCSEVCSRYETTENTCRRLVFPAIQPIPRVCWRGEGCHRQQDQYFITDNLPSCIARFGRHCRSTGDSGTTLMGQAAQRHDIAVSTI